MVERVGTSEFRRVVDFREHREVSTCDFVDAVFGCFERLAVAFVFFVLPTRLRFFDGLFVRRRFVSLPKVLSFLDDLFGLLEFSTDETSLSDDGAIVDVDFPRTNLVG